MHLREIQRVEDESDKHYFPDVDQGLLYFATCLAGEVGELCNDIKKNYRGSMSLEELRKRSHGETADVLIYLVMLATALDIDLENAYTTKKEFNERRYRKEPYVPGSAPGLKGDDRFA